MEIRTFGGGQRLCECERLLAGRTFPGVGKLILLPIPTARDGIYITGTTTTVRELASMLTPDTAVVGYNIPTEITERAEKVGARIYDAGLDEEFLCENAELTARGCLGYILTHSKSDLLDMSVGVVGYGRIGIRLVRWLLPFGADLTVYTNRQSVAIELCENGISACVIEDGCDFSTLDLLINTAPARQIDESRLAPDTGIIDLASGNIFEPSGRLVKLSSIPDAFYPLSSGRLYAEAIIGVLGGGAE